MTVARLAVVLAAGRGRRMREAADVALSAEQAAAADRGLKMLVPIHGRPYLAYVLDEIAAAGFEEVCLVVGRDTADDADLVRPDRPEQVRQRARQRARQHDPVRDAAAALESPLRLHFAVQSEPGGSAHALLAAESIAGDAPFIVINADNIYPRTVLRLLRELDGPGLAAFDPDALVRGSNIPRGRLGEFAILAHEDGWLTNIIEKPGASAMSESATTDRGIGAKRNREAGAPVSMTCWRFDRSIFAACRAVAPSARGELELPDAVLLAIRRGARFRVAMVQAGVLDISRREDIPVLERMLEPRA